MEKNLGCGTGSVPRVDSRSFPDCSCCPNDAWSKIRSVVTAQEPSRRVLKLPSVAQGGRIQARPGYPAFAKVEQELPRGWGCTDDAVVKHFSEVCRADAAGIIRQAFSIF